MIPDICRHGTRKTRSHKLRVFLFSKNQILGISSVSNFRLLHLLQYGTQLHRPCVQSLHIGRKKAHIQNHNSLFRLIFYLSGTPGMAVALLIMR